MNVQTAFTTRRIARPNPTLTAASNAARGVHKVTSRRLLEALSIHEGDSALGLLADAILRAGDFTARMSRSEWEDAENAAGDVENQASAYAEDCRHAAIYAQEQSA